MTPLFDKPEVYLGERRKMTDSLLMGIKMRIVRQVLDLTQAEMSQKLGMRLEEYKKFEEANHAPDSEKTLKLVRGGMRGFTPYDARTKIPRSMVDVLLPRKQDEDDLQ